MANPATILPTNIQAKSFAPACMAQPHNAISEPSYTMKLDYYGDTEKETIPAQSVFDRIYHLS